MLEAIDKIVVRPSTLFGSDESVIAMHVSYVKGFVGLQG